MQERKSVINEQFKFSEELAVVSFFNMGTKIGGHAALLVEMLEKDHMTGRIKLFVGQYDIKAGVANDERSSTTDSTTSVTESVTPTLWIATNSCKNIEGLITAVRCFEGNQYGRDYSRYSGESHYVLPINVKRMIASIKADRRKVTKFCQDIKECTRESEILEILSDSTRYLKYQFLGKHHMLTNENNGDNCAGWCNEKLAVAGIGDGTQKPKPKIGANQKLCCIL